MSLSEEAIRAIIRGELAALMPKGNANKDANPFLPNLPMDLAELRDRIKQLEGLADDKPDEAFEVIPFDDSSVPLHPFQIIVESPTEFSVYSGLLFLPGLACFGYPPDQLMQESHLDTTDITTITGYDTESWINVYLKVDYEKDGDYWNAVGDSIVVSTDFETNGFGATEGAVHYYIGQIPLASGVIDGKPIQYIQANFTETITGIYVPPP